MATQPAPQPSGLDPVRVDSGHYKVELENEKVRVLRIRYGPREKSTMHSHPPLVAVMLNDCAIRMTYPDGSSEEIHGKPGDVIQMPALDHLPENLGDQPFEVIAIELKG